MSVSAFPGKVVFGEPNQLGYISLRAFQFTFYQFFEFYLALVNVIKFLASNDSTVDKGLILKVSEEQIYFWLCKTVQINNCETKVVCLGIEFQSNCVYELRFDLEKLNFLIGAITKCILPCLCLKKVEKQLKISIQKLIQSYF